MKIGYFGGSFDPIHFGHLAAAQDALEQCKLDRVIFVPAAQAALKPEVAQCPAADRLAMVRAAVGGDLRFAVSDHEVHRGGVSYTVDTARHFKRLHPRNRLFWIIGADQLPLLHKWKDVAELAELVEFIVLERPGHGAKSGAEAEADASAKAKAKADADAGADAKAKISGLRLHRCAGHLLEISSTELRARARAGLPLDYFMPHKAVEIIRERGLYRSAPKSPKPTA